MTGDIEGLRREGLVDGDVDAAKPRPVHAHESREIGAGSTTAILIGWPISFTFVIAASMISRALFIVIMTVELLIEVSRACPYQKLYPAILAMQAAEDRV
jgi:hypothetical protein